MTILQVVTDESFRSSFELLNKLPPKFFIRLAFNLVTAVILIRLIYLPNSKSKDKVFTFFVFNLLIFLITYLMNKVEMSMGAAFGLFAVFTMLRYRTEDINTKDMTYMFLLIALGLINAVSKGNWDELAFINLLIVTFTYLLESNVLIKKEGMRVVLYDNIEMIKPENRGDLIRDLEKRTGIRITHITIGKVDLVRDIVQIYVYFYE